MLVHKILHILNLQHLAPTGKVHIAIVIDVAGLGIGALHPFRLPLIDHRAEVPETVEITGGGHHSVDSFRHLRGQILGVGAVLTVRQMAAELGCVLHLDLGEGVHGIVVNLLPCHGKNTVVQIVADDAAVIDFLIGLEIGLLTVQNPLGLFENRLHVSGIVHPAEAGFIGLGRHQRVVGNGVVLVDRLRLFHGGLRQVKRSRR